MKGEVAVNIFMISKSNRENQRNTGSNKHQIEIYRMHHHFQLEPLTNFNSLIKL